MKKRLIFVMSFCLLFGLQAASFAGFVSFDCEFPDDPTQAVHNWTFTGYDGNNNVVAVATNDNTAPTDLTTASSYKLVLGEIIYKLGYDQVEGAGTTDQDPIFHVQKTVTNESETPWTSYELMLDVEGDANFVIGGSNFSDVYNNVNESSHMLTFSSPDTVGVGETVVLDFDIEVPVIGPFNFCLTQNPVPEPMTAILLGLGGMMLRIRKR